MRVPVTEPRLQQLAPKLQQLAPAAAHKADVCCLLIRFAERASSREADQEVMILGI